MFCGWCLCCDWLLGVGCGQCAPLMHHAPCLQALHVPSTTTAAHTAADGYTAKWCPSQSQVLIMLTCSGVLLCGIEGCKGGLSCQPLLSTHSSASCDHGNLDYCRYQHLGDMMSLGTANAAVALPIELPAELTASIATSPFGNLLSLAGLKLGDAQQQQGGVTLEGPLAQLLRRAAYLYRQPTNEQRINVAASWLQQAADAAQRMLAEASSSSAGAGSRR